MKMHWQSLYLVVNKPRLYDGVRGSERLQFFLQCVHNIFKERKLQNEDYEAEHKEICCPFLAMIYLQLFYDTPGFVTPVRKDRNSRIRRPHLRQINKN